MANVLSNFRTTLILSLALAAIMIFAFARISDVDALTFGQAVARWAHVGFGILWIGLLYYFNFVQIRVMPTIPGEPKPAVSKYIAPEALFWFRWAALATMIAGIAVMGLKGHAYAAEVMTFGFAGGLVQGDQGYILMGIGVWLAIIMFLNVWGIIWPNQKRALGIVVVDDEKKAKAARVAMLASRTNLLLSLPMLTSMAMYQTLFG